MKLRVDAQALEGDCFGQALCQRRGRAGVRVGELARAGTRVKQLARTFGMTEATIYNWKSKYGGLEVSEAKRLKALEDENAKLKKLLAEAMLDVAMLKDLNGKKF